MRQFIQDLKKLIALVLQVCARAIEVAFLLALHLALRALCFVWIWLIANITYPGGATFAQIREIWEREWSRGSSESGSS